MFTKFSTCLVDWTLQAPDGLSVKDDGLCFNLRKKIKFGKMK